MNLNSISKFFALALFATGAALVSSSEPSQAQASRAAVIQPGAAGHDCCEPATKPIVTGSPGWTLTLPNGTTMTPVAVVPKHPIWAAPLPGSQWVANAANAAQAAEPGGVYIYEYHFCLCPLPNGVHSPIPASLSVHFWADDDVKVTLNNSPVLASHSGGWGFTTSPPAPPGLGAPQGGTPLTISLNNFQCDNVLRFAVNNMANSPTGLDVAGTISGYFQDVPPGGKCNCTPH